MSVSLRSGPFVWADAAVNTDAGPPPHCDTESADEPEELEPLSTKDVLTDDLHQPAARLDDAGNKIPDQSADPDDLPEVDMDCPLRVTFGNELRYAPSLMELIRCRRH